MVCNTLTHLHTYARTREERERERERDRETDRQTDRDRDTQREKESLIGVFAVDLYKLSTEREKWFRGRGVALLTSDYAVLGSNPATARNQLMAARCFIAKSLSLSPYNVLIYFPKGRKSSSSSSSSSSRGLVKGESLMTLRKHAYSNTCIPKILPAK